MIEGKCPECGHWMMWLDAHGTHVWGCHWCFLVLPEGWFECHKNDTKE